MRKEFDKQLKALHTQIIEMGALCEDIIGNATLTLINQDRATYDSTLALEQDITLLERELEQTCVRLILHQQPMAGDLRQITAAQKILTSMERISVQAANIAEISLLIQNKETKIDNLLSQMATDVTKMVTESINSFVTQDLELAQKVIQYDDTIDTQFLSIKDNLDNQLTSNSKVLDDCLDLLMITKYFERIGDHAENIATWVIYAITGSRTMEGAETNDLSFRR